MLCDSAYGALKSLMLIGARNDNKLYFIAAPAPWTFGGSIGLDATAN